ncbi:hypothetical protein QYE76_039233, partial [Lolium multiflorum]
MDKENANPIVEVGSKRDASIFGAVPSTDDAAAAAADHGAPSINFNQFLEKEKLKGNGSNFTDWSRHVRIFLTGVSMQSVLEAPLGPPPPPAVSEDIKNVYETRVTRYSEIQCAILCSLEAELQKRFEHHDPCEMMRELKLIFETHAAVESYEASKQFFNCMMEEGSSVSEHMFAMSGHAKKLSDLGIVIPNKLGIHRVLQSLPPSYKNFVMNYNMQNMNKELPELFSMLKSAEVEIKKENQVLMVNKTTSFKKQGKPNKGNFKKGGKKVAAPPEKPKAGPKPETVCYYCQGKGHWKRNCTKYLADLKSGHAKKKGIFDIHVIDVYLTGSRSSELRNKRSLARDEVTMRVGNGSKVDVIAVGTLPLHLPSGLVLNLNNCYLVPALSMNIISGSCLMQDGYSFKSENNGCSIYMSNVFYGHAPEMNGLFLLNLDSSDTHVHNIDAKRIKLNDNSTYMWHCRLGHIGVKRMKKLHSDGLLESLDFESLDRCEACLMGKMTKTPFSGTMERATDLLEIIHTDVCGPMSVASRGGYRYVLTFTDDLSRYGYIYFMKHKSETFEKFKEFQSEVENQQTAAFTLNRAPSKSVETTPYELWFGKKPKLSFLKVWGCDAYVKKLQPDKLEPKAEKCVFIGYPKETIGYTFYHRSEGKIFVAKNGSFLEKEFLTKEVTGRKVELDEVDEPSLIDQSSAVPEEVPVQPTPIGEEANDDDHETSNEEATEPRRSTRERTTPDWYDPCLNVMIVDDNDEDPATYEEAMMSPDSNKWQEAMKSEMGSMYDNKVWTLVDLPDSRKAVENKWIFKRKTDADGNITVYKARLVAKGFRQIQGVDYDETFSPVAKLKSVRILLAIAAFFDYEIWQMDVKTAFLNGDIEEELYMVQPKGFVDPKNADKVCKLQRSIYGLKQASRSWNLRFDRVIKDFGFIRTHGEACIYKKVSGSSVAFLILYVDDILLIGNDIELLGSIKGYLNKSFSMKDLGEAAYILGIKIYRDRSRRLIGLSQSTYLDKILKKFRMDESKKGFLPMLPGKVLSKTQGPATADERERMSKIPYASAVGSIMYAMLCTRPDIAHAVSLTSRYQSDPGMEHWTAVKNILKYLKRTKDIFLCYGGDQELVVTSYTDASWNTDPDDSKSQSGYVFILNGAAVSWSSSKQCTVAKSSTESEYIAASEASSEAVWMKRFIVELGVVPSALDPLVIYCDNTGAIANAKEPRSHKKLKHIKLRFHSIREYIEDGEVEICKVHTDLNVADPLTKALPRAKHDQHQNAMGVSCYMEDDHEDGAIDLGASPTMMEIMPVDDGDHFLEKEKLKSNGSNFTDWFRHVRIFLNGGNLQYVLDAPLGDPPAETETDEVKNVYATRKTRYSQVQCAILCSLESDLQKRFEHHDPHELMKELKTIFETHAAVECYEASKHFFSCMMEEGSSISEHMLVMTGHAKKLSDLGIVIPNRLGINRVLQSLPPSYKNFVMNYNMQNMNKEFPELFGMLKAAEIEIKKEHQVLMVNKTTSFKKQGKSKGKFKKGGKKAATPPMKPKNGPKPDADCYYCKEKGHWKRNCSNTWVFDTGSVAHICNSKQELKNKRQLLKDEVTMRVGNGSKVNVIAVGTLPLHLPSGLVLSLNNCYYVPALSMNIISGSCLMQDGYSFKSENNGCSIFMNNIFYGRAPEKNGLFLLDLDSSDTHIHNIDAKRIKLNDNSTYMWHCRLGHIGVKRMKKLHTDGLLESLDFESLDRCEACLMGKMTKTPFSGMMERATDLLEIIHTDVCGPMSVASRGGYRYVLTFTDDLSRYGYIYLMKHKSETFEKFKEFQSEVENQRNKKIKFLRSDRGGEYLSYEFGMHLKKCGILSQLTPPGTPQRNGVSERRNRTLLDMVRSMMSLTDLPLSFWSYALETAAFTLNRAPSKSVETTPYELWFNKKPKLSFLKVWGCEAYVKKLQPDKLEPKAEKCVFIGYPKETIGYTFYHRSEGKIFVAKNGTFLEKEFLTKEVTGRKVELDEIEESLLVDQSSAVPENVPVPPTPTTEEANDNDHETSYETATEPRRSTRDRATPDWYDPCLNVMIVDNNDEDPATYEEAMMSPDSNKWQEAMKSEMGSMYDNKVWTLVDLPDSRKAVENKWIFKRKTDADGNITVYKARLVAKGFRQIQGVDYDETFSPVAKLKSVRILLAIAAFFDYEIWQMDVKTAFLNGDIEEELYMVQPKGFVDPKNADKVCKLQRSIYGLKQASRSWNRRFDKVIKDFGFIQCHGEACIYKKVSGSSVAFLILYVDDILLIGNDIELLSSVKGYLNNSFSMKDLGEASYILGIKIYRDRSKRLIGLSQSTYLDKILKKFRMDESKKGFLPMLPGKVLSKTQGPATAEERERMSQIPYASAVGSIMYAMLCTRPDIAHAVSLTSRYQSDPGMEHWTAVKNILKYLKRTKDMFLCYGGDQELVVTSYTDASWNTDPDDSKSQSGYVFILNGAAVSWASSKQCTVAKSSTESEYIAASEASSEAVWMKRFIVELGVVPSALDPFVIYCDNMGAIANAQEPRSHKRLKHIKLRYHSIREYIEDGEVKICKVHTDLNVADPLTKALPRAKHDQHQNAMGVRNHQGRWSPQGTPPPWPASPSGGGVPSGLHHRGPATPHMG